MANRRFIADQIAAGVKTTDDTPVCVGCNKTPWDIPEYYPENTGVEVGAEQYVRENEGTYNPLNGHFMCTDCYITAGMPSNPWGWVAD